MKRIIALLLCVLMLSGCGKNTVSDEQTQESSTSGTTGTTDGTFETLPKPDVPRPEEPDEPEKPSDAPTTPPVDLPPYVEPDPDPDLPAQPDDELALYNELFDLNSRVEIDIDMPESELRKLQADYEHYREMGSKSPIYRRADVTITVNGKAYFLNDVGVRMKGNTSRTSFFKDEEGGIYKAIHLKLDFQETFEDVDYYGNEALNWADEAQRKARKDRTFATMEKLELRWNKCLDNTYLRELYAYELYRSEGVLAPLVNLCSLDWSEVHMGVFTLNEPVDKVFLEKRLPEEDLGGDLYKCGWTWEGASFKHTGSIGIENEDKGEFYCYDLKTNKKTSEHQSLITLIKALNSPTLTKERFEELVDVDSFLDYAAVSYFLGNPDDLRNNYNNYYIYFLQSSGKMVIIPYDYDRCLGVTVEYNPSGHAMTTDNPFSDRREGAQNGPQEQDVPLFYRTVVKGGWYVKEYADALNRVSGNTLLTKATFAAYFERAKGIYGNDVRPSRPLKNMGDWDPSFDLNRTSGAHEDRNMSFADYIDAKMATFRKYIARVDEYLNYERPVPATHYIRGDFNGWSNDDRYAMKLENGLLTYTLSFNHDFSFKVYDNLTNEWYGTEFLPEDWELEYETDGHDNFDMKRGTYYVTFDPETLVLTVTKQ